MLPAASQRHLVLASSSPRAPRSCACWASSSSRAVGGRRRDHGHPDPIEHVRGWRVSRRNRFERRPRATSSSARHHRRRRQRHPQQAGLGGRSARHAAPAARRWHTVFTGVALADGATHRTVVGHESTDVRFHAWDDDFLRRYVATASAWTRRGLRHPGLGCVAGAGDSWLLLQRHGLPSAVSSGCSVRCRPREVCRDRRSGALA